MSLSNYGQLKAAVAEWLNRTDQTANIPDFIRLAEATLNKVLRSRRMTAAAALPVAAGSRSAALPGDLLEVVFVTAADNEPPLEQVAIQQLVTLRQSRMKAPGAPRFFAVIGDRIELAPTPAAGIALELVYYRAIPPLMSDGASNWLLDHDPDIYLYTTLLHAAQFLHDAQWASVRESLLLRQITAAISANQTIQMDAKAAGPSLDTPSDPVRASA